MLSWNGRSGTIFLQTTHLQPTRGLMANTKKLEKDERKKAKRTARRESQDRQTAEAARLSARKQEAENQEVGSRHFEAPKNNPATLVQQIALSVAGIHLAW